MRASSLPTIARATLVAGALDITGACVFAWLLKGIGPVRVLQSVASALLDKAAYNDGLASAALGLALHFAIMAMMVTVFVVTARRLPMVTRIPLLWGGLYGLGLWTFMNYVVLPLRWPARFPPTDPGQIWSQLFCHIVLVGMSIGLITAQARSGRRA